MESRIEQLLNKYWAGETSLQEEQELKAFYKANPSLTPTGMYFRGLNKTADIKSPKAFKKPGGWFSKTKFSVAATIAIGILVGTMILRDTGKKHDFEIRDPQQAYEIAQTVLGKMSASLNEAQTHSTQLNKLNRAEEIIKEAQL
jgi:hypothetical protein